MLDTAPSAPPVLNTMNHGAYHTVVGQRVCCTSPAGGISFPILYYNPSSKKKSSFSSLSSPPALPFGGHSDTVPLPALSLLTSSHSPSLSF